MLKPSNQGLCCKAALFMGAVLLLGGCTSFLSAPQSASPASAHAQDQNNLKKSVGFSMDSPALQKALISSAQDAGRFVVQPDARFSQFSVEVTTENIAKMPEHSTAHFGRITRVQVPVTMQARFIVKDQYQSAIHRGEVVYEAPAQNVYYPNFSATPPLNEEAWHALAQKIYQEITPYIAQEPWVATIISQVDTYHYVLNISDKSGLSVGAMLHTESQPTTFLQIVTYEKMADGDTRAVAKLTSGIPLTTGRKLIPLHTGR